MRYHILILPIIRAVEKRVRKKIEAQSKNIGNTFPIKRISSDKLSGLSIKLFYLTAIDLVK